MVIKMSVCSMSMLVISLMNYECGENIGGRIDATDYWSGAKVRLVGFGSLAVGQGVHYLIICASLVVVTQLCLRHPRCSLCPASCMCWHRERCSSFRLM